MSLGCGRLFEGTAEQMLTSLSLISSLPPDIAVYSGHEYANQNAKFALTVDPKNSDLVARSDRISRNMESNSPNVPVTLIEEKKTNPFLRSTNKEIQSRIGLDNKDSLEVFTKLREMKDNF
jgi:hydroxyacylglutathione hydrolase